MGSKEVNEAVDEIRAALAHLESAIEQLEDATFTTLTVGESTDVIRVGDFMDVTASVSLNHEFVNEPEIQP